MASVISAGNATNGLGISSDNTGILQLKTGTGAGTTALTIDASQNLTVAGAFSSVGGYPAYECRAWVNFNGTGTVAIRASGNVSSITDNGVGNYTVNFVNALADANYSVGGSSSVGTLGTAETRVGVLAVLSVLAASVRVLTPQNSDNGSNPGYRDYQLNSVAIFR